MRTAIYYRVNTEGQEQDGTSLPRILLGSAVSSRALITRSYNLSPLNEHGHDYVNIIVHANRADGSRA
jgi:hypothetical protein